MYILPTAQQVVETFTAAPETCPVHFGDKQAVHDRALSRWLSTASARAVGLEGTDRCAPYEIAKGPLQVVESFQQVEKTFGRKKVTLF